MNIASIPISTTQYQSASSPAIGIAVLSKNLETVKTAGQGMIKMMEQSVNPGLGKNIDMTV
jgi:hypothetical protein